MVKIKVKLHEGFCLLNFKIDCVESKRYKKDIYLSAPIILKISYDGLRRGHEAVLINDEIKNVTDLSSYSVDCLINFYLHTLIEPLRAHFKKLYFNFIDFIDIYNFSYTSSFIVASANKTSLLRYRLKRKFFSS